MLVEEIDLASIKPLGNLLADLVRATALNHLQIGPAVLRLGTGRRSHEERIPQFSLQVILLNVVCQSGGNLPTDQNH